MAATSQTRFFNAFLNENIFSFILNIIRQQRWYGINAISWHYNDVIMGMMASQITSLTIVYSTVYSGADQKKHQSSASVAFVRGIHRWPVKSPHKWPVTQKMLPFDDVIMKFARKDLIYHQFCACWWLAINVMTKVHGWQRTASAYIYIYMYIYISVYPTLKSCPPIQNDRYFADDVFKCIFMISNFIWVYCYGSNWQQTRIGLDDGLVPNRRQSINWTNADPIHRRINEALGNMWNIFGVYGKRVIFLANSSERATDTYNMLLFKTTAYHVTVNTYHIICTWKNSWLTGLLGQLFMSP